MPLDVASFVHCWRAFALARGESALLSSQKMPNHPLEAFYCVNASFCK